VIQAIRGAARRLARGAASVVVAAGALLAQNAPPTTWTKITYISGSTIYLEMGSKDGLAESSRLDVVRGGAVVARLHVTAVSSGRASCEVLPPPLELAIGDSVRFVPVFIAPSLPGGAKRASTSSYNRTGRIRGRLGLRYLVVAPDGGVAGGLTQPAYDLRLDGQRLGGTGFGLTVDMRAQRTQYAGTSTQAASSPVSATRVYQAALSWAALKSGLRVTAGRQMAGSLSSVGIFDGLSIDFDRAHFGTGVFAGSQPDATTFGTSSLVREYGAYTQVHSAGMNRTNASFTLGGVGSYVGSAIDREYAFARFTSTGPFVSIYATQELDFNRGWRFDAEHKATTPTSTFASVQINPVRAVSIYGGVDNRRSVRLYRDYVNPEVDFDDAFREGTWEGVSFSAPRYARVSIDRRDSRGGSGGTANSTTVMASLNGLTRMHLGFRARATDFSGNMSSGQLASGALEVSPWNFLRVEGNGGARRTSISGSTTAPSKLTWWGVDADVGIGRSLYLLVSTYREKEVDRGSLQTYVSISWRF
jgi:hypothetical protein